MKECISKAQFSIFGFFTVTSLLLGSTVYGTIHTAHQDAWIGMILSYLISFLPLFIYYKLLTFDSKSNIIDLINKHFKKIGKLINIVLILFIIYHSSLMLWNLTNFINSQYLYQTPPIAISILFLICLYYMVNSGLNNLGKTAVIVFLISGFLELAAVLTLIPKIDLSNLKPFFEYGSINILKAGGISLSYNVLPLFALLIIPKDNIINNKKLVRSFLSLYSIGFLFIFTVIFYCIAIMGANLSNLYQYPEYHILRLINVGDFFQRVEPVISLLWIFNIIMTLSLYIFFCKKAIMQNFKIKKEKLVLSFVIILILIVSRNLFKNNTIAEIFLLNTYPFIVSSLLFIIPTLILIFIKIKKN